MFGTFYARSDSKVGRFEVVMLQPEDVQPAKAQLDDEGITTTESILGDFGFHALGDDWAIIGKVIQGEVVIVKRTDHVHQSNT